MEQYFEGERGDSNPRIAAPQATALTTWRRPPHIYKFNNLHAKFHDYLHFLENFELFTYFYLIFVDVLKYNKTKKAAKYDALISINNYLNIYST